jgi:hypothetical protein
MLSKHFFWSILITIIKIIRTINNFNNELRQILSTESKY